MMHAQRVVRPRMNATARYPVTSATIQEKIAAFAATNVSSPEPPSEVGPSESTTAPKLPKKSFAGATMKMKFSAQTTPTPTRSASIAREARLLLEFASAAPSMAYDESGGSSPP